MYIGLTQSTRHAFRILVKFEFSRHILEKYSNVNFRENPSSVSRFFCADRRKDGRTVMTNLIVAFFNFANASKNNYFLRIYHSYLRISFRCFQYLSFEIEVLLRRLFVMTESLLLS
jgi:hypothetical protein